MVSRLFMGNHTLISLSWETIYSDWTSVCYISVELLQRVPYRVWN